MRCPRTKHVVAGLRANRTTVGAWCRGLKRDPEVSRPSLDVVKDAGRLDGLVGVWVVGCDVGAILRDREPAAPGEHFHAPSLKFEGDEIVRVDYAIETGDYAGHQIAADVNPGEVGPGEVGPGEVGPGEVGPVEVGPVEVGPGEVGPGEVGPGEVSPNKIGSREVSPGEGLLGTQSLLHGQPDLDPERGGFVGGDGCREHHLISIAILDVEVDHSSRPFRLRRLPCCCTWTPAAPVGSGHTRPWWRRSHRAYSRCSGPTTGG